MTDYVIMPKQDYENACDAIRQKSGKTDLIVSGELASEINELNGGEGGTDTSGDTVSEDTMLEGVTAHDSDGNPIVGTIETYNPDEHEQAVLQSKTVTENGTVFPDSGYVALSSVIVNVDTNSSSCTDEKFRATILKTHTELTLEDLDGITEIGWGVFANCQELVNVELPSTLTEIGNNAFFNCVKLASIRIPKSVTYIGFDAFGQCGSVESIVVEEGGDGKYWSSGNCLMEYNLVRRGCKNSVIPNTTEVDRIGPNAFDRVTGLPSVFNIPSNIIYIGPEAFSYASGVDYFDFRSATSVCMLNEENPIGTFDTTEKFIVPDSLYDEWIATACWASYADRIIKASEYSA